MALGAERVTGCSKPGAVRLVTVRARDTRRIHPALQERSVLVDFVLDLAIGEIKTGIEQRNAMGLRELIAVAIVGPELCAP